MPNPRSRRIVIVACLLVLLVAALGAVAGFLTLHPRGKWCLTRGLAKVTGGRSLPKPDLEAARRRVAAAVDSAGAEQAAPQGEADAFPLAEARVVVHKARRAAELYDGDRLIKIYRCALGGAPAGDKVRKGDQRTPEGIFHIRTRNARSQYGLFMGLDYPLAEDAERGLKGGLITPAEHGAILAAHRDGKCPPWLTGLGGAVGLHGGGAGHDWTLGCVAFDDADAAELWAATRIGTPVEIRP